MSQDYTEKYLKYKNKYLKLKAQFLNKKQQSGGARNKEVLDELDNLTLTPTQSEVYGRKLKSSFLSNSDMNDLKLVGGAEELSSVTNSIASSESVHESSPDSSSSSKSETQTQTQTQTDSTQGTPVESSPIDSAIVETQSASLSSLKSDN